MQCVRCSLDRQEQTQHTTCFHVVSQLGLACRGRTRFAARRSPAATPQKKVAALSNAAGIGGGSFFVPLYVVLGMNLKVATGLSQASIAGGSIEVLVEARNECS